MDAPIAVTHPRLGDFPHPLLQLGLIGATTTIVVARSLRPKHAARPPEADLPGVPNIVDELAPPIRPQSFRDPFGLQSIPRIDCQTASSCNIALSRLRSATKRVSFMFSSSNWRILRSSDGPTPPYFELPLKFSLPLSHV